MSGSSLLALALRDAENDAGAVDPKEKLRAEIAKGNLPTSAASEVEGDTVKEDDDGEENKEGEEGDNEENNEGDGEKIEETEEQKKEREANEKIAAKAKRKEERMQRRIDEATAAAKSAKAELEAFKAANPDLKLTEEEVQSRAEKIAADKLAAKQAEDIQIKFNDTCARLMRDAIKVDKDFDVKVHEMADQFGPIPTFMIGLLDDIDNGAEVLAHLANDDDAAEKVYNLHSPAKMAKEITLLSIKLADAKKPPKKHISRVPDPVAPVTGNRSVSTTITEADTKNMEVYAAKRRAQQEAARKARGY